MAVVKLLKGLKNIHFAPIKNGEYQKPVAITNAKKIDTKLNYESSSEWGDDRIVSQEFGYNGGEGTFTVLGLTAEEQSTLFGNTKVKGGVVVKSTDVAPEGAFLFERSKKGSTHKRLYVVYACKASQTGFSGETIEEGKSAAAQDEINFAVAETLDGLIYHYIDTDDPTVDQAAITAWYTTVQKPTALE